MHTERELLNNVLCYLFMLLLNWVAVSVPLPTRGQWQKEEWQVKGSTLTSEFGTRSADDGVT